MECVGHDDIIADGLYVERHVVMRQPIILEPLLAPHFAALLAEVHSVEPVVVDIHATFVEIGCVEVELVMYESAGQTRVNRSIRGFDHGHGLGGQHSRVPTGNGPINCGEQEDGLFARCQ